MSVLLRDASCRRLLWINGAVLALLVVCFALPAGAQNGQATQPGQRARGEYTMISGKISVGSTSGVYILDSVNQERRWSRESGPAPKAASNPSRMM